jgi:hypothetical protein
MQISTSHKLSIISHLTTHTWISFFHSKCTANFFQFLISYRNIHNSFSDIAPLNLALPLWFAFEFFRFCCALFLSLPFHTENPTHIFLLFFTINLIFNSHFDRPQWDEAFYSYYMHIYAEWEREIVDKKIIYAHESDDCVI